MTRYAIIMSVENYKHFTPTKFTHADSDLIYKTLTKMCDYAEQHAIILKLSPDDTKSPSELLSEIKSTVKSGALVLKQLDRISVGSNSVHSQQQRQS